MVDREFYDSLPRSRGELVDCPPICEDAGQRAVLDEAIARAREAGLLIPDTLTVHWRIGRDGTPYGTTHQRDDGSIHLFLDALRLRFPEDLRSCVWHESQHVSDMATGIWSKLEPGELERRADTFRFAMIRGESIPEDLLPSAPAPASTADRARAATSATRSARVDYLHRELQRRLRKLSSRLPGEDGRNLRAALPAIAELAELARREV